MKKSIQTDMQCVAKILKYIGDIKQILINESIKSYQNLENSLAAKYAVTQLITNVYELSTNLQPATLQLFTAFNSIEVSLARHISSHVYDKVNFRIIYRICTQLTDDNIFDELNKWRAENANESIQ